MAEKKLINEFVNMYPVSKTLRWRLIPVGRTLETIKEYNIIETDTNRAVKFKDAKDILDEKYKAFLLTSLESSSFSEKEKYEFEKRFVSMADSLMLYESNKDNKEAIKAYYALLFECRKALSEHFKKMENFEMFSGKVRPLIFNSFEGNDDLMNVFGKFTQYFNNYVKLRKDIFSPASKSNTAGNRLFDENFPLFYKNYRNLLAIKENYAELYEILCSSYPALEEIFSPGNYLSYLPQSGIDFYNTIIGGYSNEDGSKIQGLNELVNLYGQQNEAFNSKRYFFKNLRKMLLEDRATFSYVPMVCNSDEELLSYIGTLETLKDNLVSILEAFDSIEQSDFDCVYVNKKFIPTLSINVFGSGKWNGIWDSIISYERAAILKTKTKGLTAKDEKYVESCTKKDFYSISYLVDVLSSSDTKTDLIRALKVDNALLFKNSIEKKYNDYCYFFKNFKPQIRSNSKAIDTVKDYVTSLQEAALFLSNFLVPEETEIDELFYQKLEEFSDKRRQIIKIYNLCRNYITAKTSDFAQKVKLNFSSPVTGGGWASSVASTKLCQILRKGNTYYLAIRNKLSGLCSEEITTENCAYTEGTDSYELMVMETMPDPSKAFPQSLMSSSWRSRPDGPSKEIQNVYDRRKADRSNAQYFKPEFNCEREYQVALMDYYIRTANRNLNWSLYNFNFKKAEEYSSLDELFADASEKAFLMKMVKVSAAKIDALVEEGSFFLFKIHNQDFVEKFHGTKNLYTLYWEYLFSEQNMKNPTVKLNGGAEFFYRPATGEMKNTHPAGSMLVNHKDKYGSVLPSDVRYEIYEYANGHIKTLSEKAKIYFNLAVIHPAKYSLYKDRRYHEDQFFFHVPVTFNYNATSSESEVNARALQILKNRKVNILAVNRGERNLLYVSVVDPEGKILFQESLNKIKDGSGYNVDYFSKLSDRENVRDSERKSWKSVSDIKNLKEGYLSAAINYICKLMIDYDAILCLEDLTFDFKQKRMCIERSVYQKFETMLLKKLSFLVDKKVESCLLSLDNGAAQLSYSVDQYSSLKGLCGLVLFINPALISKTDPETGFTNPFYLNNYTTIDSKKKFFQSFDSIVYKNDCFYFDFDTKNFDSLAVKSKKTRWTVTSQGERSCFVNKDGKQKFETVYPTLMISKTLESVLIDYKDGCNIVEKLASLPNGYSHSSISQAINELFAAFSLIMKMRNYDADKNEEYFISPADENGKSFDSRKYGDKSSHPCCPDSVDSYNLAKKAAIVISRIKELDDSAKLNTFVSNEEFLELFE